jgi:hypothetical protein
MLEVKVLDKLLKVLKNLQNKHFSLNKVLKMLSPQDFMPHICHTFTLLSELFSLDHEHFTLVSEFISRYLLTNYLSPRDIWLTFTLLSKIYGFKMSGTNQISGTKILSSQIFGTHFT